MPTGYQIDNQSGVYFLTLQVVEWVDIFTRKIYVDTILDSLAYCRRQKGLKLYAYVVMSNHLHMIVSAEGNLSDVIRDFKRFTATSLPLRETNSVWLKLKVRSSGPMDFIIIPDNSSDDLDFVLFRDGDCDSLKPIRVMSGGAEYENESEVCLDIESGEMTWHHFQDGKTMQAVLVDSHNLLRGKHIGGNSIVNNYKKLIGLFDGN